MEANEDTSVDSLLIISTVNNVKKRLNQKNSDSKMVYTQITSKKVVIDIGNLSQFTMVKFQPFKLVHTSYTFINVPVRKIVRQANFLMFSLQAKI